MKKQTSIYLSEKDIKIIEELKEIYECESTTSLVRMLIRDELNNVNKYKNLISE